MLPKIHEIISRIGEGLKPDQHDMQDLIWADGRNVRFKAHGVQKRGGFTAPFTKPASLAVRGIAQLQDSTQKVFWGDKSDIYMWDTSSVTNEGTSYTGITDETSSAPATGWSFVEWGTWMIASNGVDTPQVWKGTSFAALGGTPPSTAEIILKLSEHLVAFNTDADDKGYEWSDTDDPEDWVPVADNRAGNLVIRHFSDKIVAACPISGDNAIVYTKNQTAIVSYVGEPYVFSHERGPNGPGAVSKYSVVQVGSLNYGLSPNGFFMTDGVNFEWLGEDEIKETVFGEINRSQMTKVCAYHDIENNEVTWFYPTSGTEPDKGIIYNYKEDKWSFTDYGRTACMERFIFDYPMAAGSDGTVYYEDNGADAGSSAMYAWLQSKSTPCYRASRDGSMISLEDQWKYIDALKVGIVNEVGGGLTVRVGVQDKLDDDILWTDHWYVNRDMDVVYPEITGRWITFRIESNKLSSEWEVQSITAHGMPVGGPPQ